jgi:hypothetical protein
VPFGAGPLANGAHTFAVRAITGGDRDPTPATRSFTVAVARPDDPATPTAPGDPNDPVDPVDPVDAIAPVVRFTHAPKSNVKTRAKRASVSLEFDADESNATFACSVDGATATPCASPQNYRLRRGKHSIAVTATDAAGNTSAPAIVRFTVKRRPRA